MVGIVSTIITFDVEVLFSATFALAAATLFPAFLFRIWVARANDNHILSGMIGGFCVTSFLFFVSYLGLDFSPNTGDEIRLAIPFITNAVMPMSIGLWGMIISTIIMLLAIFIPDLISDENPEVRNADA